MEAITKSGIYYPNRLVLATFNELIDLMGKNGLNAILSYAHLRELIDHYPPDNFEKRFDFADFTAIQIAIEDMYGEQSGHAFLKRAGRTVFSTSLCTYGALAGVSDAAFRALPLQTQLRIGIQALARIFSQISDQMTTVEEFETHYSYIVHQCPECWNRAEMEKPICSFGVGLLEEGLKWISGGSEFRVNETKCRAMGDEVCEYSIEKLPIVN
jgi:predicted hydrocarbon binding protein